MAGQSQQYWCKFQTVNHDSLIMAFWNLTLTTILLFLSIYFYALHLKQFVHSPFDKPTIHPYRKFYCFIISWLITLEVKLLLNIIAYNFLGIASDQIDKQRTLQIVSAIALFLDYMSTLLLHTLLFVISCVWLNNIMEKCLSNLDTTGEDLKKRISIDKRIKILRIFKKYSLSPVRFVLISLGYAAFMALMIVRPEYGKYSKFITILTILEAFAATICYIFGLQSVLKFRDDFPFPKEIKIKVLTQYLLLACCCIFRFSFDLYYFYLTKYPNNDAGLNCSISEDYFWNIFGYLIIGGIIMNFFPCCIILLAYKPDLPQLCKCCENNEQKTGNQFKDQIKKPLNIVLSENLKKQEKLLCFQRQIR